VVLKTKVVVAQSSTSGNANTNIDKTTVEVGSSDKPEEIQTTNWLLEEEVPDEEQQDSKGKLKHHKGMHVLI